MKKIVFFDVDGVLVKGQSQELLLKYLFLKKEVSLVFFIKLSIWFILYKIGFVKNTIRIRKTAFLVFSHWSQARINVFFDKFHNEVIRNTYNSKSLELLNNHILKEDEVILVSASLREIIKRIAKDFNVGKFIATDLEIRSGVCMGRIKGEVPYGQTKASVIKEFILVNNLSGFQTIGYSDHISDLPVLNFVDCPVVINPSHKLRDIANKFSWKVYDF